MSRTTLQLTVAGRTHAYAVRFSNAIERFPYDDSLGSHRDLPGYIRATSCYDLLSYAIDSLDDSHNDAAAIDDTQAALLLNLASHATLLAWAIMGVEILAEAESSCYGPQESRKRFDALAAEFFAHATTAAHAAENARTRAATMAGSLLDAVA